MILHFAPEFLVTNAVITISPIEIAVKTPSLLMDATDEFEDDQPSTGGADSIKLSVRVCPTLIGEHDTIFGTGPLGGWHETAKRTIKPSARRKIALILEFITMCYSALEIGDLHCLYQFSTQFRQLSRCFYQFFSILRTPCAMGFFSLRP